MPAAECGAWWRRSPAGGHCVHGNATLQPSATLESIHLDTDPRWGRQQDDNRPQQRQLAEHARQQEVTGEIPSLDGGESRRGT